MRGAPHGRRRRRSRWSAARAHGPRADPRRWTSRSPEHAGKLGIAIEHLESWRDPLAALAASVAAADLSRAIHARKAVACQVAQLRAAYRGSDLPALARMLLDPVHGDRLLVERNRRWAPLIERYLERGGGFVAVGLGHLLGDSGLPAMLAREGYRVTREAAP
jgi:uncharacterized protein YbaP (TraB family)